MQAENKIFINFDPYHLRLSTGSFLDASEMVMEIEREGRKGRIMYRKLNNTDTQMYDVYESEVCI